MTQWPPLLPDHAILSPWRPMHPDDLAQLREEARLGPCEGIECTARHLESNKLEIVTQLRPIIAPPARAGSDDARARLAEVRRAMGEAGR